MGEKQEETLIGIKFLFWGLITHCPALSHCHGANFLFASVEKKKRKTNPTYLIVSQNAPGRDCRGAASPGGAGTSGPRARTLMTINSRSPIRARGRPAPAHPYRRGSVHQGAGGGAGRARPLPAGPGTSAELSSRVPEVNSGWVGAGRRGGPSRGGPGPPPTPDAIPSPPKTGPKAPFFGPFAFSPLGRGSGRGVLFFFPLPSNSLPGARRSAPFLR